MVHNGEIYGYLNPRTPCGVRQGPAGSKTGLLELKSTHSMRSATAILYRNIVFLHRLHLFFWTNCFVSKNIIVFSRVSLFLSGANLSVFSVHFPFALLVNCNISQVLRQSHCIFAINKKAPHRTLLKKNFVRSLLDELRVDFSMYLLPLCFSLGSSHCLVCYDNIL